MRIIKRIALITAGMFNLAKINENLCVRRMVVSLKNRKRVGGLDAVVDVQIDVFVEFFVDSGVLLDSDCYVGDVDHRAYDERLQHG